MLGGGNYLITSVRLVQIGNNRNDFLQVLFRCPRPLTRGVRLMKVSFKVNKGNDEKLHVKLSTAVDSRDAHAIDIKYHKNCWTKHVTNVLRKHSTTSNSSKQVK